MARSATLPRRGFYFDLQRFADQLAKLQTPTTPALSLMYALAEQLDYIADEGLDGRFRRHWDMAERCWAWVAAAGERLGVRLTVLAPAGYRSPTVTCIQVPKPLSPTAIVTAMKDRGFVIGSGYGKLKDSTIRIGHMGDHTASELEVLLSTLEEVMQQQ